MILHYFYFKVSETLKNTYFDAPMKTIFNSSLFVLKAANAVMKEFLKAAKTHINEFLKVVGNLRRNMQKLSTQRLLETLERYSPTKINRGLNLHQTIGLC